MLRSVRSQTEFWAQALCTLDDCINAGKPAYIQQVRPVFEMARLTTTAPLYWSNSLMPS